MRPEDADKISRIVWSGGECLEGDTVGDILASCGRWIHRHVHDGGPVAILQVSGSRRWHVLRLCCVLEEADPDCVKDVLSAGAEVELFENNFSSGRERCPVCARGWRSPLGWVLAFKESFGDIICDECAEELWPDQWEELQSRIAEQRENQHVFGDE